MLPLMPKATAVWLVENTTLTFPQIADFCGLHELEIQAIADGEVAAGIVGADPIANGQLTRDEIERAQADPEVRLVMAKSDRPAPVSRPKGPRYTPVAKRQDRPDAISWLVKNHPELADPQIAKLVGTTKSTIAAVRERTHWNSQNIKQRDPVTLGLCTMADLNNAVDKANRRLAKAGGSAAAKKAAAAAKAAAVDPGSSDQPDVPVE
jgi:hypothetical protein